MQNLGRTPVVRAGQTSNDIIPEYEKNIKRKNSDCDSAISHFGTTEKKADAFLQTYGYLASVDGKVEPLSGKLPQNSENVKKKNSLWEGDAKYTKNNESIEQLLSQRRQVPKAMASNAFEKIIEEYEKIVKKKFSDRDLVGYERQRKVAAVLNAK